MKAKSSFDLESLKALDWTTSAFRPALISGMAACITAGWVLSFQFFLPAWRGYYLVPLIWVVSLETLIVEQQLRTQHLHRTHGLEIRLAEFALVFLILKPVTYLDRGWLTFLREAPQWLRNPLLFFDMNYLFAMLLVVLMWPLSIRMAGCLAAMQDASLPQEQQGGLQSLKDIFMFGAFVLLFMVGLQRIDYSRLGLRWVTAPSNVVIWLPLIYVGLGLLLFGQARLTILLARWEREGMAAPSQLSRRWVSWGVLFVGGVIALALILPGGDTAFGFFLVLWLAGILSWMAQFILFLFFALLALLLSPCLALFKVQQLATAQMPPPPAQVTPQQSAGGTDWFLYLRLLLFWGVVAFVLFQLLRIYWHDRKEAGSWGAWRWMLNLWRTFLAWLLGWKERVETLFQRPPVERVQEPAEEPEGWWMRWRARTARERVRRLYLALLQRAAQAGRPRRPSQTPFEYANTLGPTLPEEADALETLTGAFIEARYGRRDFPAKEESLLRRIWQRLRAALRRQAAKP